MCSQPTVVLQMISNQVNWKPLEVSYLTLGHGSMESRGDRRGLNRKDQTSGSQAGPGTLCTGFWGERSVEWCVFVIMSMS